MGFQGWRMQLRQTEAAFQEGRLDEAAQMLRQANLDEFLPGKQLAARIAGGLARRARLHLTHGEAERAWQELERARGLVGETDEMLAANQELVNACLRAAESDLAAGSIQQAVKRLEQLRRRRVALQSVRELQEVAQRIENAASLARRGRFADADSQLEFAARLRPELEFVQRLREENRRRQQKCRQLDAALHEALAGRRWSEVLSAADALLDEAAEHRIALDSRRRAWAEVGHGSGQVSGERFRQTPGPRESRESQESRESRERGGASPESQASPLEGTAGAALQSQWRRSTPGAAAAASTERTALEEAMRDSSPSPLSNEPSPGERCLLWVDAVGGFLVCLDREVTLGQAGAGGNDVPILADISGHHAKIRRQAESYVLEPLQAVRVNGKRVAGPVCLSDGDQLELGSVRLRFCQPHALSATARLDFLSRHRTQPSADAVLLMAESCVLGPSSRNHVHCPDWESDVVLFRKDGRLHCRSLQPIEVDGVRCDGTAPLRRDSQVAGEDFSLKLESL